MGLDTIANVQINKSTVFPSQKGFGTGLFVALHSLWTQLVREISSVEDLDDLSINPNHHVYRAAQAYFGQNPKPQKLLIGKRSTSYTQVVEIRPLNTTQGFVYSFDVRDSAGVVTSLSYTVLGAATTTTVGTAIAALIDPLTGVAAVSVAGVITCTSTADAYIGYRNLRGLRLSDLTIKDVTPDPGLAADLSAIDTFARQSRLSWFAMALDRGSKAEITAAAAWIEARNVIFVPRTSDSEVADSGVTNDVLSTMKAAAYEKSLTGLYSQDSTDDFIDMAALGRMLPYEPGVATWAFKTLRGINPSTLTAAEETAVQNKRGTTYTEINSINVTFEGHTPDGDYLDNTIGLLFCQARVQEAVFGEQVSRAKIPFTQNGINVLVNAVQGVLDLCTKPKNPIFAVDPAPLASADSIADTPAVDKSNRALRTIVATATLQGAIHKTDPIKITVTL